MAVSLRRLKAESLIVLATSRTAATIRISAMMITAFLAPSSSR